MRTPRRCRPGHSFHRIGFRPGLFRGLAILALASGLALPVAAQDLVQNLVLGGSVEVQAVYDHQGSASGSALSAGADDNSYRAQLVHRGLWELQLAENRFVLAHELTGDTEGNPELVLQQAYLSLGLGYSGRLDMGRQEVPLGLGYLFQPVDPLAGSDGLSTLDGLALVLNPWANHGLKAVLALDGLWDASAPAVDGIDSAEGGDLPLEQAWRRLLFGLRYDGLVGAWEPGLAFFFRDGEYLRLAASSRLGLGPAIVRLEGAWDLEQPDLWPGSWLAGGGMGLAGIDLYLYPAGATVAMGVEYAYRGLGLPAGQWDTRHQLGLHATLQPTDRLSLSGLLVVGLDYPEGAASSMAEVGIELNRPENIDLFLHLQQSWTGRPWDGKSAFSSAMAGFRVYY